MFTERGLIQSNISIKTFWEEKAINIKLLVT